MLQRQQRLQRLQKQEEINVVEKCLKGGRFLKDSLSKLFKLSKLSFPNVLSFQRSIVLISICLLSFFLARGSFSFKNFRFNQQEFKIASSQKSFSQGQANTSYFPFLSSGQITNTATQGKYIFSDGIREYVLYSDKDYQIGDRIYLFGNLKLVNRTLERWNVRSLEQEKIASSQESSADSQGLIPSSQFLIPNFGYQFNYDKWLLMKGYYGTIREENSIKEEQLKMNNEKLIIKNEKPRSCGTSLCSGIIEENKIASFHSQGQIPASKFQIPFISLLRRNFQKTITDIYGKNRISGLILGMLIGDRSQIPKSDYQNFINSGLVHIVAVSGGNIVLIIIFLGFVLFFLPFYLRNFVILLAVIFYGIICGLDSSVFRAVLMGGLGLLALFRGREINIRRTMAISYTLLLLINPYYLIYDIGFLFSFAAVAGIVILDQQGLVCSYEGQVEGSKLPFTRHCSLATRNYLLPTLGATIGIFPIMIFFMGKINLIGIIGNLLVLPILAFAMIYGFCSIFLYSLFGWAWILFVEKALINYIYRISNFISSNGLYISIGSDWLKYLILGVAVRRFIRKVGLKSEQSEQSE